MNNFRCNTWVLAAVMVVCLTSYGCSSHKYTLQGEIEGFSGTVYLLNENLDPLDSTATADGTFRFTGTVDGPGAGRYLTDNIQSQPSFIHMFFAEPGSIRLRATPSERFTHVSGTPANDALTLFSGQYQALGERAVQAADTPQAQAAIQAEADELVRQTIAQNTDNYFGALLFAQLASNLEAEEVTELMKQFPKALQQTALLREIGENALRKMHTAIGQPYTDIVQPTPQGTSRSLKSVVEDPANKYVLVDFWASWCNPCMREVPYLKAAYDTYHDRGFEIYGVSFDSDQARWVETIERKNMNWIHVSDLARFDNQAARDYAVDGIPSNFLIETATGNIVATNLRGEALSRKIAELLQ